MARLGIMTAKKFRWHKGSYYTYGGFGRYLDAIRQSFEQTTLIVQVANAEPDVGWYRIDTEQLEIIRLPTAKSVVGSILNLPLVLFWAWRILPRQDVVHARMPDFTGVFAAMVCRTYGVPVFCQIIADWQVESRKTPWNKRWGLGLPLKIYFRLYDWCERRICVGQLVFAQGESCFNKHADHCDAHLAISTAHHGCDLAAPSPRFASSERTLLTVGRLTGVKNHALVLRVLEVLNRNNPAVPWKAVFVGEGPLRDELTQLATKLQIKQNVTFAGQVAYGDPLWSYYDSADVFVLASHSEGTPKALLEAMARCVPVVASCVGGIPSLIGRSHERGLMFEDNNIEECVSALRTLETDRERGEERVLRAREFAAKHTVEKATAAMVELVFQRWPQLKQQRRG